MRGIRLFRVNIRLFRVNIRLFRVYFSRFSVEREHAPTTTPTIGVGGTVRAVAALHSRTPSKKHNREYPLFL